MSTKTKATVTTGKTKGAKTPKEGAPAKPGFESVVAMILERIQKLEAEVEKLKNK